MKTQGSQTHGRPRQTAKDLINLRNVVFADREKVFADQQKLADIETKLRTWQNKINDEIKDQNSHLQSVEELKAFKLELDDRERKIRCS